MGVSANPGTGDASSSSNSGGSGGGGGGNSGARAEGELRHCFSFHYKDDHTNVWGDAWDCTWGGEIVPQPVGGSKQMSGINYQYIVGLSHEHP